MVKENNKEEDEKNCPEEVMTMRGFPLVNIHQRSGFTASSVGREKKIGLVFLQVKSLKTENPPIAARCFCHIHHKYCNVNFHTTLFTIAERTLAFCCK